MIDTSEVIELLQCALANCDNVRRVGLPMLKAVEMQIQEALDILSRDEEAKERADLIALVRDMERHLVVAPSPCPPEVECPQCPHHAKCEQKVQLIGRAVDLGLLDERRNRSTNQEGASNG